MTNVTLRVCDNDVTDSFTGQSSILSLNLSLLLTRQSLDRRMSSSIRALREIPISEVPHLASLPSSRIRTDEDVEYWKRTQSYTDYGIFLRRLNESIVGYFLPWEPEGQSRVSYYFVGLLHVV